MRGSRGGGEDRGESGPVLMLVTTLSGWGFRVTAWGATCWQLIGSAGGYDRRWRGGVGWKTVGFKPHGGSNLMTVTASDSGS